jgi:hypothetical protein
MSTARGSGDQSSNAGLKAKVMIRKPDVDHRGDKSSSVKDTKGGKTEVVRGSAVPKVMVGKTGAACVKGDRSSGAAAATKIEQMSTARGSGDQSSYAGLKAKVMIRKPSARGDQSSSATEEAEAEIEKDEEEVLRLKFLNERKQEYERWKCITQESEKREREKKQGVGAEVEGCRESPAGQAGTQSSNKKEC